MRACSGSMAPPDSTNLRSLGQLASHWESEMEDHERQALEQRLNKIEAFQRVGLGLEEKLRMRVTALEVALHAARRGETIDHDALREQMLTEFGKDSWYWDETDRASAIDEVLARLR